jgi:hypothetical protein
LPTSPPQCDEDDYGYESRAQGSIYDKLMSKFEETDEDPMSKFSKAATKGARVADTAKERLHLHRFCV